jgi:GNAT superfamily N-acetyltransferase
MKLDIRYNQPIDAEDVLRLLNKTYWAKERNLETMKKALEHSETVGVYDSDHLIGFARIVTDYATMFWLCDVVVDEAYRGQGIAKTMMVFIQSLSYYDNLKGLLATNDAFKLYEKYGFEKEAVKMMVKKRQ